jgi:hypothetical protein
LPLAPFRDLFLLLSTAQVSTRTVWQTLFL